MATRWGIVSAGRICNDFVTSLSVLSQDEHQVKAIAARDVARAQEFAKLHNIPKAYGSYEELANDKDLDVIYIGNVNCDHFSVGMLMINNNKHVLIEKPLTVNKRQSTELINAAKAKKVFLMEAVWSRFTPAYNKIREDIANNVIGEPINLNVTFGVPIMGKERLKLRDLGGGCILDIGIYCLQLCTMIYGVGAPIKVAATGTVSVNEGVDESCGVVLLYEGGKMATLTINGKVLLQNDAYITGEKGTIKVCNPFWTPTRVESPSGVLEVELPNAANKFNFTNSVQLRHQAQEVRRCILAGELESKTMSHEDSLAIASLEDQLRRILGVQYAADS
ncbi:trans-1,2-dihydrobenzene-1,2-diol dehydrogenase-like [Neocloeon triangulifer]|uniref:trans-1,2-dihydrobenzene-1,2-diol dehydrogenase-like n=1 Tax=Neocloeon triangulifer TaxID=2078957 RepID=UPI00286F2805|nr:trans-1,2-dihydrobenzene-1,2-diol dehydrogenase-like [Neocloeon triangulifer]XP_059480447.1 trans-1,2-dihydrobenzene-1,2-diol dehydrogenase-like [Neocloeon triangulifer]XP_059480448.1 trans-1,2-dihydrobenzene-1,2-diol dehydrogenase-like [Neocloeon triangulifer]